MKRTQTQSISRLALAACCAIAVLLSTGAQANNCVVSVQCTAFLITYDEGHEGDLAHAHYQTISCGHAFGAGTVSQHAAHQASEGACSYNFLAGADCTQSNYSDCTE